MDNGVIPSIFQQVDQERYAQKLGLRLITLEPGHAIVEMKPRDDVMNIFGMTHGGAIFSLIDEAFQVSCNSHGTVAVALNVTVTYHRAPDVSSTLRAESTELHISRKTGSYEIKVTDDQNRLIATCLALAYRKKDKLPFIE